MTTPHTITVLEAAVKKAKEELTAAQRALPPEPIRDYTLRAVPSGAAVALRELFGTRDELILIHNMGKRCPYCTLWADGFSSMYKHLADRAAFVLSTPDEPAVAGAFASARGWTFPVVSHAGTTFAHDLGYKGDESTYGSFRPGMSTLFKNADGAIVRTATRAFGPGDDFCVLWPMLGMLHRGENEWAPKFHY